MQRQGETFKNEMALQSERVYQAIKKILVNNQVEFQEFEHPPVKTSEEAARIRKTDISHGAKALIFEADKKPILIVVPGNLRVDTKKFKALYSIKDLRMLTPQEILDNFGLEVGSIAPFGNVLGIPTYFDQALSSNIVVDFNAGFLTKSIEIKYRDLENIVKPVIDKFSVIK